MALTEGLIRSYLVGKLVAQAGRTISAMAVEVQGMKGQPEILTWDDETLPPTMYVIGDPWFDPACGCRRTWNIHIDELVALVWGQVQAGLITAETDPDLKNEIVAANANDWILGPWLEENL
jgi:hypothetical protein